MISVPLGRLTVVVAVAAAVSFAATGAAAIELCGTKARVLMRSVGISEVQIERLCAEAARASALLTLNLVRAEDELGYCRVTLALTNNSTEYLNSLVVASEGARFDLFRFSNVLPGGTAYASANSRILLACDELPDMKLTFHWPVSLRIADRSPDGRHLQRYKPYLLDPILGWSR